MEWSDHISVFLLGVLSKIDLKNPKRSGAIPFVKVGMGYSISELNTLRNKLKPNWRVFDPRLPSNSISVPNWKPSMSTRPDVVVSDLSQSVIFEVKAAELLITEQYPTRCTLRFPRVVKIRYEDSKPWNEAMTKEDLDKMMADYNESRRIPKRKLNDLNESISSQDSKESKHAPQKKKLKKS